ncbi:hypothetical protein BKA82DRAFT_4017403 [Pisolithus tinctorius]|nr:hypothetical protein BKA82DRAFT_4017403 [Pisolithus tinctorius]
MSPAKRRCLCEVYRCANSSDCDPLTNLPKRGCLLAASSVYQHRRDDKVWWFMQQQQRADLEIMMASTDGESTEDPVVSSRLPQRRVNNYRKGTTIDSAWEGFCQRILRGTVRKGMFQSSLSAFHWAPSSRLTFVSSSPELPGDAPPKIDWRHSHSFVQHQQVVAKLLESVNTLQDEEDQIFMAEKKALVSDIQEHQLYLGRIMKHEWSRHQAERTTDMTALSSDFPVIVKTGIYFYYPMLL